MINIRRLTPVVEIDIGSAVLCDVCGEDFTDSPVRGGFLWLSKAVCPTCAPRIYQLVLDSGELWTIKERCPDSMTFVDWCRELRGGNNKIQIGVISD
jgi:hypothetical protein